MKIATRRSALALWQAEWMRARLAERGIECELSPMSTEGDRILDRSLALVGGKGLFVKELERALLDGKADLAVHSAKDVPFALPEGLELCAFPAREDPRDALIAPKARTFDRLPPGARVGTSSLRRSIQLQALRPDLQIVPVRGNVKTRLDWALDGRLDAVVLASAGLRRLGLIEHATELLPIDVSLPAAGQGALAIEAVRGSRGARACAPLDHQATARCVRAERAVLARLGGGCTVPIAAYAVVEGRRIHLRAAIGGPDGQGGVKLIRAEGRGTEPEPLGTFIADELILRGATGLLKAASGLQTNPPGGSDEELRAANDPSQSARPSADDDRARA